MAGEVNGTGLFDLYQIFMSNFPEWAQTFLTLFVLVILVVVYSVVIWKFYRFVARKNILGLNLKKYNRMEHPVFAKLTAGALAFIEYIIILPFLIFIWFSVFSIFLIILTDSLELEFILATSAIIISAIRVTSYIPHYGGELAKEIAKILPFTLLAFSILNPNFFSIERISNHLTKIPGYLSSILTYLLFIIILEAILRLFDLGFGIFGLNDEVVPPEETRTAKV